LFELGEETLDAPALLVGDAVVGMLMLAMASRRNDRFPALIKDDVMQTIGIIGAIGEHLFGWQSTNEVASRSHVVLLSRAEMETNRQPEGIHYSMDFAAKSATGAAESLGLRSPLLRRPPAACACARITVASMDSHSISGSAATASNIRSNTP